MNICKLQECDRSAVIAMMETFYASPAVQSNGSPAIFQADVDACLSDSPYLEGYTVKEGEKMVGYAMLAKSFSTEFGKPCVWIEDLYFIPDCRKKGYGTAVLRFVAETYPDAVIRLEVEEENEIAVHTYKKAGFTTLPYQEMIKQ